MSVEETEKDLQLRRDGVELCRNAGFLRKKRRRNQNKKRIYRCLLKKQKSKKTCNYAGIAVNYAGITGNYAGIIGNKPAGNMNS